MTQNVGEATDCDQAAGLPAVICSMIARALPHSELPNLRLVSKAWCYAASSEVRKIGRNSSLTITQFLKLPILARVFPCLSELNVAIQLGTKTKVQVEVLRLLPQISGLRDLSLDYSVGQSPQGLQFIQQQTHLTKLCITSFSLSQGVTDDSLNLIGSLVSLVKLELNLSCSATDRGISNLSHLTNLQSLRLPVSKYEAEVTGSSVTVVTGLRHLTYLSLIGWPIEDCHVDDMTCLTRLQRIEFCNCLSLTAGCFLPLLQFQRLESLDLVGADGVYVEPIVDIFMNARPNICLCI